MKEKVLRAIGEFFIRKSNYPESFSMMGKRHEKEIEAFQSHCAHKRLNFDFQPFVICSICQKTIRRATDEEIMQNVKECWERDTKGLSKEIIENMESPPMVIAGFYDDDNNPI